MWTIGFIFLWLMAPTFASNDFPEDLADQILKVQGKYDSETFFTAEDRSIAVEFLRRIHPLNTLQNAERPSTTWKRKIGDVAKAFVLEKHPEFAPFYDPKVFEQIEVFGTLTLAEQESLRQLPWEQSRSFGAKLFHLTWYGVNDTTYKFPGFRPGDYFYLCIYDDKFQGFGHLTTRKAYEMFSRDGE